ncbi:hypothetical protein WBJ53_33260 (plasmid) [Spirosoma sp. SC4-14]|uniref:hypothetical protein n=1 Tax=Spirosoma sp. SC4-14 TaxID=3128900 RepID=UPI0030D62766
MSQFLFTQQLAFLVTACLTVTLSYGQAPQTTVWPAPPQNEGLPYTRSGKPRALEAIRGTTALFAGSRYAYVNGYKVRLDTIDLLRAEAFIQNGNLFVPETFGSVISIASALPNAIHPKPVPAGLEMLASRWVYDIYRPAITLPESVEKRVVKQTTYVSANALAKHFGKQVYQTKRGLLLISDKPITYREGQNSTLDDCIVTLFDTPEKLMDPAIATRSIPMLTAQGPVTAHARFTPDQLKILDGPEAEWPETPRSEYDLTGFNQKLLGSAVPPPGVYPRLLFSPDDVPMLQQHIRENKSAQKSMTEIEVLFRKTWWNPSTSDGRVFDQLASGELSEQAEVNKGSGVYAVESLTKDHKPGITTSHINYVTNCLTTMALYCLLTDNATLGKKVASAISTYYQLIDKKVDAHLLTSDSEFGTSPDYANNSETHWRGMHSVVPHMDLAFSLDFAGKYMTTKQLHTMQQLIAKATYGRRTGGGDGPRRAWRDMNHLTWHLTHHLAIATIEGLDGFDPEAYASGCELARDFLEWGIDKNGQMFESNGKSGGGMQFQILAMIMQARRGDNLWGHPHLRKMLTAQVYTTSPDRRETVSSGTWGGSPLALQTVTELKAFYPNDRAADYLIQAQLPNLDLASFDLARYHDQLEASIKGVRLPGPTYPGFGVGFPYIVDWKPTTRADLNLPLDWNDAVHGVFSTASDRTENASWLCLHVRPNHYIGSGHHHADIGMFYMSGLGVNWITESPFPKTYSGKYHNEILIDGKAEADGPPAAGKYLGARISPDAAFATADQSYAYSWQWCTQVQDWGKGFSAIDPAFQARGWELEPDTSIINIFKGTSQYKMRPWWPTSNFSNWIPTLRAPWNPVDYVYRSTGLVKGLHPYAVVVDDAKKDGQLHRYQWTAMLARGVWEASYKNRPDRTTVLAYDQTLADSWAKPSAGPALDPKKGDPLLLVVDLSGGEKEAGPVVETATDGPDEGKGPQRYNRLTINRYGTEVRYRILLIPFRFGDELPVISYQNNSATITWKDQTNTLVFDADTSHRSHIRVRQAGNVVGESR